MAVLVPVPVHHCVPVLASDHDGVNPVDGPVPVVQVVGPVVSVVVVEGGGGLEVCVGAKAAVDGVVSVVVEEDVVEEVEEDVTVALVGVVCRGTK